MRFDNKQFESNVQTSMSTLDKLKQKLNLSGAAKGLDNIDKASKHLDMNGLSRGVESVTAKFSALQVMGTTALVNITNSAVNAGKRMVSALTIDPVKDGLAEYETQINAVQTILANTQKEGTNVKMVNAALDELNTYADKTIYNFTEMTRNIGTFTAAGVKLKTSVSSIQGIANLAAVSGSNSQQASTAMYQLSQAIAAGTVKLMDWNSVVNAGMGGQVFQDALIRTSEHLQTGAKAAISAKGSFRESLQTGWLTTEVLTQTLDQFATAADTQEEYEAAVKKFISQGYSKEEAKQMADMAKTAGEAATKVKTFSQLIDTTKEALGSGWTETWRIVIGDFEEAKELWTSISDVISGFVNKTSEARNKLVSSALGKNFTSLSEKISKVIEPVKKTSETIKKSVDTVSKLGNVVDKVILGKFGNGEDRFKALTKAGQNYYRVQNKVNETLGNSFRYTKEQIASQDKILGIKNKVTTKTKEESKETDNLTRAQKMQILNLTQLSEAQLKSKGYTDKQIASINELKETAKKLGIPIDEFILNIDKLNGRLLLINSFKNIGQSIVKVFKAIGDGWQEVIDPMSADDLFNIIAAFHKFTRSLIMTDETADKLKRTFKGVFALLDIITTITGGGLKLALKGISAVLNIFGLSLLDVTAIAGDFITSIRDFLFSNNLITSSFKVLASGVKMVVSLFEKLIDTISELPQVQKFFKEIENIDLTEVGNNILEGLKNGLKDGVHTIPSILIEIGKGILDAIKGVLGIHSPSTKMYEIGLNVIQGLVNGIKDGLGKIIDISKIIASKLYETVNDVDWDKVFVVASTVGLGLVIKRIGDILDKFASPFEGLGSVLESASGVIEASTKNIQRILKNTSKVIKSFSKVINAKAWQMKASALKDMAISIAILAAAVYVLAQLDVEQLTKGVSVIGILAVILVGLAVAMNKFASSEIALEKSNRGFSVKGLKTSLISIGMGILLIATTAKMLGGMNPDEMKQGFQGLAGVVAAIAIVFATFGTFVKGKSAQNIDKAGKMIKRMATAMLLMTLVVKLVGMLSSEEMKKGVAFAVGFVAFVTALTKVTTIGGKSVDKLGGMMVKMALAMTLMVGVVKLVGKLSPEEIIKGATFAAAFMLFVKALIKTVKMDSGSSIAKVGGLLLSVSISMALMVGVMKLVGMLSASEIAKGTAAVVAFGALMVAMIKAVKNAGPDAGKMAGTLMGMSVAIGIMAGVCVLMSMIDVASLAKGLVVVGLLSAMLTAMIWATRGASDCMKNLIVMSSAIAVMAGAVALLSFLDTKKLAGATICLSTLMGMFAIMSKSTPLVTGSTKSLVVMVGVIAALAGICYMLASLPIEATISSSAALSVMLLSMATALAIISKVENVSTDAVKTMAVLTVVMGAIGVILGLLNKYDLNASSTNAATLSGVLLSLAATTKILSTISSVSKSALVGISALTLIMGVAGVILGLLNKYDLNTDLETAEALSMLLIALSTSCAILGSIGTIAGPAATGAAQLMLTVGAAAAILVGVASLVNLIPGAQKFLDGGIQILEKLGYGLGSFFGNIVGGFASGTTSGLPEIADNLKTFVNTFSGIDKSAFDGVKVLADVITEISAAGILNGISKFLNFGEDPMKQFAENVTILVGSLVDISTKLNESGGVDTTAIEKIANVGDIFAKLQSTVEPAHGLLQAITGNKNLGDFGNQISAFVNSIKEALSSVSDISTDNLTNLESISKVGLGFTKLQSTVEPAHGLLQAITGNKNLGDFGTQIAGFASQLVSACKAISGENAVDLSAVENAVNAGKMLSALQKALPEDHWFDGKMDLKQFGSKLSSFGDSMKNFGATVADVDIGKISKSVDIANRIKKFVSELSKFDSSNISKFEINDLGEAIQSYGDSVSDLNTSTVSSSITAANRLKNFISSLVGLDTSGVSKFKSAISELGKTNVSQVASAFSKGTSKITSAGTSLTKALSSGIKSNSSSVTSAATSMVSSMQKTVTSKASSFTASGNQLATNFIRGITAKRSGAVAAAKALATSAASASKTGYGTMHTNGAYLGSGLIIGINSKVSAAYAAGYALGRAAVRGEKDGQNSNSPSKDTIKAGKWLGEGLVIGTQSMTRKVYKAGHNIGEVATQSISTAISSAAEMVNMGIDSTPTIRPVVDLSDVKDQASLIGSLFGNPIVSPDSDIRAIKSIMDVNNQNGNIEDIVSAINKLRKDIGNTGNTYNSINGITYDNGSEISEAVGTLVRAARIERRR
jgi:tape measure domain-containing protein